MPYSSDEERQEAQHYSEEEDNNALKRKRDDNDDNDTKKTKYDYDAKAAYTVMLRNLPYSTTEEDVKERFSKYGEITRANIPKNERGQSRGYGFVEFAEIASATTVVELKEIEMDGRSVMLQQSKARDEFSGQTTQVFVGNLPDDVTEEDIKELFRECGEIEEVRIPVDTSSGKKKGFAFVQFKEPEPVKDALKMDGTEFKGKNIRVNEEKSTRQKQRRDGGGRFNDRRGGGRGRGGDRRGGDRRFNDDRRGGDRRYDDRRGGDRYDDRRGGERRFDDRRGGDRRGGERRFDDRR